MLHTIIGAVALAVAALTLGIAAPPPSPAAGPPPASSAGDPLTLMTFNIRYATAQDGEDAWDHRRELLAETIRAEDPDVIGLQEALRTQLDDLARLLPGYTAVGVGRDDGKAAGEHCAILYRTSRFALADEEPSHGTFWLSDTPEVPGSKGWGNGITRICTWARLMDATPAGEPRSFYIYNVHLDHQSQPSRERAAELLAERMGSRLHPRDPAVLMGDFNAGERNPVLRYLTGAAERASRAGGAPPPPPRLLCAFRAANPDAEEVGTFHGFKGGRGGDMIDYILVPRRSRVLGSKIVHAADAAGRYPSDHFPVVATIQLWPEAGGADPRPDGPPTVPGG